MDNPLLQPTTNPQPLRINIQCSMIVESEEQAKSFLEEIGTFIKGIQKTAMVSGVMTKMFGPCCGDKKP